LAAVVAKAAAVICEGVATIAVVAEAGMFLPLLLLPKLSQSYIMALLLRLLVVGATGIAAWKIAANTNLIAAIAIVAEAAMVSHEGTAAELTGVGTTGVTAWSLENRCQHQSRNVLTHRYNLGHPPIIM
jgi:hypothetical protein